MSVNNYNLHAREETAGAAITRWAVVQLSSGDVIVTTGPTDVAYGVAQDAADSGDKVDVLVRGLTKAVAGGTISKGDKLQADASGNVVADDETTASRILIGEAYEDAASGDTFQMIFEPDTSTQ